MANKDIHFSKQGRISKVRGENSSRESCSRTAVGKFLMLFAGVFSTAAEDEQWTEKPVPKIFPLREWALGNAGEWFCFNQYTEYCVMAVQHRDMFLSISGFTVLPVNMASEHLPYKIRSISAPHGFHQLWYFLISTIIGIS